MGRKFLITSIFMTLGAIAFLSSYLLNFGDGSGFRTSSLLQRFNSNVGGGSVEIGALKTLPLSGRKFISFISPGSERILAVDRNGDVVEIDTVNFRERVVIALNQTNISEALLSPAGDSVVYSFYDAGNSKKHVYLNFSAKGGPASGGKRGESTYIPGDLKSSAFSPQSDQTAYLISNADGGELLISKGVNIIKRALKTRLGAAIVSWPADFISIITYNKDGYGDLFILKVGGELNKIISYQNDLNAKWSPSGEKIIFSAKGDGGSNQLFYKDIKNNGAVVALDIGTNASKCVWLDEGNIVCGIKNQVQLKDEFYKIGLTDGSKTLVATPTINLLAKELALNRSGNTLFVLNDIDDKLYALKIKP